MADYTITVDDPPAPTSQPTRIFYVTGDYDQALTDLLAALSGGGGGLAIGDPVENASPGGILYTDVDGNLAQDSALTWTPANGFVAAQLLVGHVKATVGVFDPDSSVYGQMDIQQGYFSINGNSASGSGEIALTPDNDWQLLPGANRFIILGKLDGTHGVTVPSLAGTAGVIPFVDADGKLGQNAGLLFDPASFQFSVSGASNDPDNGVSIGVQNAPTDPGSKAWMHIYCMGVGGDTYLEFYDNGSGSDFIAGIDSSDAGAFVISKGGAVGTGNVLRVDATTGVITAPSLAGTGSRHVVVDANGVLSAP